MCKKGGIIRGAYRVVDLDLSVLGKPLLSKSLGLQKARRLESKELFSYYILGKQQGFPADQFTALRRMIHAGLSIQSPKAK